MREEAEGHSNLLGELIQLPFFKNKNKNKRFFLMYLDIKSFYFSGMTNLTSIRPDQDLNPTGSGKIG